MSAPRRCAALALCALAAGCGADRLRGRASEVGRVIRTARAQGAERCAPVELAMADAHSHFVGVELDEGDYYRARAELEIAEKNARDAVRLSPADHCAVAQAGGDHDSDGVPDERDECATQPEDKDGIEDADGCPDPDNDNDGLADAADKCPVEPEDRDGFADEDGCPDQDNDKDQLADRVDQCPDQAEDADGVNDDDGCPDCDDDGDKVPECPQMLDKCPGQKGRENDGCPYRNVVVTAQRIEIKRPVEFAAGKAKLKPSSNALLDEVAQALADNPTVRVRIEGHTDSQGRDRTNLRLSRLRAAAVKRYLVGRGIDQSRIVSEGYGEARPIAENSTAAGRAQNRRVEFVITGR